MLQLKQVIKKYGARRIQFRDYQFEKGGQHAIIGASGSGKTTFLHLVAGLLRSDEGEISWNEKSYHSFSQNDFDEFRSQTIGIIFQRPHLIRTLNVLDNLRLAAFLSKNEVDDQWLPDLLEKLGLAGKENQSVTTLSQGESQRLAIARAVVHRPELLLADEPTASLDDQNCDRVLQLLTQVAEETGATLIITTHDQRVKKIIDNTIELIHEPI
ncbi:MAG: ATP-binding cassette domain-containing protein [Cyclobacteriaceae bacterium]|nr:ATP-binding cassette domain-containing protein [Cyclobacteriaceae bacterium]MCH8516228.1 ATP-binding cassette domain-containing protein [Cyclobacteriaceae bacterium]